MLGCSESRVNGIVVQQLAPIGAAGEVRGPAEAIARFSVAPEATGLPQFPEGVPGALHIGDGLAQRIQRGLRRFFKEGVKGEGLGGVGEGFAKPLPGLAEARLVDGVVGKPIARGPAPGARMKMGTTFAGMVTRCR